MTQSEHHWLDEGRHGPTPEEAAAAIASCPDDVDALEQLRARVRHVADLIENDAPWTANRADTAARVRDAVEPQENPPGSTREQLPDDVLATLSPRIYLSTACDTARRVDAATIRHPENADLPARVEQLHAQCPLTREYTGEPCYCRCHKETT